MCPCACRSPLPNGSFARLPTCCATEAQPGRAFQSLRSAPPVPRKLLGLQALRGMPPTPSLQVSPSTMPRPRADSPTEDRHRSPTRRPAHGPRVLPHWGLMTGRAKPSAQGQVSHAQEPEPALCTQVPGSGCGSPFRAHPLTPGRDPETPHEKQRRKGVGGQERRRLFSPWSGGIAPCSVRKSGQRLLPPGAERAACGGAKLPSTLT